MACQDRRVCPKGPATWQALRDQQLLSSRRSSTWAGDAVTLTQKAHTLVLVSLNHGSCHPKGWAWQHLDNGVLPGQVFILRERRFPLTHLLPRCPLCPKVPPHTGLGKSLYHYVPSPSLIGNSKLISSSSVPSTMTPILSQECPNVPVTNAFLCVHACF